MRKRIDVLDRRYPGYGRGSRRALRPSRRWCEFRQCLFRRWTPPIFEFNSHPLNIRTDGLERHRPKRSAAHSEIKHGNGRDTALQMLKTVGHCISGGSAYPETQIGACISDNGVSDTPSDSRTPIAMFRPLYAPSWRAANSGGRAQTLGAVPHRLSQTMGREGDAVHRYLIPPGGASTFGEYPPASLCREKRDAWAR